MAQIVDQTIQTLVWPCKTREQMDTAGWELWDDYHIAAHTFRMWDQFGNPIIQLHVNNVQSGLEAVVDLGNTLVFVATTGKYVTMTDEELEAAGLPVTPTPDS